jgi:hypothetical protein
MVSPLPFLMALELLVDVRDIAHARIMTDGAADRATPSAHSAGLVDWPPAFISPHIAACATLWHAIREAPYAALMVSFRLSNQDVAVLRGVLHDPPGSVRNIPSGRSVTAERIGAEDLELRVRSDGPADEGAPEVAEQVLGPGWAEVPSRYPGERAFRGRLTR